MIQLLLILGLLVGCNAQAQSSISATVGYGYVPTTPVGIVAGVTTPPTTVYTEGFEGAQYDSGQAYVESDIDIDPNDTTATPIPQGSDCLIVPSSPSACYAYPTTGWTARPIISITGSFRVTTVGTANKILQVDSVPNSTHRGSLTITTGGALQIYGDETLSVSATTSDTVTIDTWYFFRARWNKTTGAYSVEFNTSGTFNDTGTDYASNTDGDTGVTIGGLRYYSNVSGYTSFFDNFVVTTP